MEAYQGKIIAELKQNPTWQGKHQILQINVQSLGLAMESCQFQKAQEY